MVLRKNELPVRRAKPIVRFTVSPREASTADTVQLVDCSYDPGQVGIAWRAWDFGDGETSVGSSAVHRYASAGEYEIALTLATYDGRVSWEQQTVTIRART
jgi:PKD repeat protein